MPRGEKTKGYPVGFRGTFEERLWSKVGKADFGCWIWEGAMRNGYGVIGLPGGKKLVYAHRAVYEIVKGSIPKGMHLDHLCSEPACCNPDHLELVTPKENVQRSNAGWRMLCKAGHLMSETRKGKVCGECDKRRKREWAARKKAGNSDGHHDAVPCHERR